MVFIRRVRTASGATAVQIAEYVDGRQRIVKHVGSARSEAELGMLLAQARQLLEPSGQDALDLGVEAGSASWRRWCSPPAQPELFAAADTAGGAAADRCGPVPRGWWPRTPELLFDALAALYSSLGFDVVGDEVFRDLVIARVVEPTSLLDTARVLSDLGRRRPATRP